MSYSAPGVYIEDKVSGSRGIEQASSSVGILFGVTASGVINTPVKIGSWAEYIENFANGLKTPYLENSYLPYAVYGFFQNGGKELYVVSLKKNGVKASGTTTAGLVFTAKSEGAWGNNLKATITKNADWVAGTNLSYDVKIENLASGEKKTVTDCYLADIADKFNSVAGDWCTVSTTGVLALDEEDVTLTAGSDGTALTDGDYVNALDIMNTLDDVTLVAIPGQTSNVINDALISYCDAHELFPLLDMPMSATVAETKSYRKSINAFTGALLYPWGKTYDPLTDSLKSVPCAGHAMGVYARVITKRGVWKSPAGTEAQVRGFVDMVSALTPTDISTLNPVGVVCVTAKTNFGIVLWGARSLNTSDSTMKYVSDGILNLNIKKSLYAGTQWAVFEPNDEFLWKSVSTSCRSFLETLRTQGAFKGSASEAYYVTCDSSNNTPATIANGELNIEVGYAPVKPAEFVIIKLSHSIEA